MSILRFLLSIDTERSRMYQYGEKQILQGKIIPQGVA